VNKSQDVRGDIEDFFFRGDAKSSAGCVDDVSLLYDDIYGESYDGLLQATRGLTLAFAALSALKIIAVVLCFCCGGASGLGWMTLLQVLAGWAGWLTFLAIILLVAGRENAHEAAAASGPYRVDVNAASDPASYWGHAFWLFFASTFVPIIGSIFTC
jgi:hypothetical protein